MNPKWRKIGLSFGCWTLLVLVFATQSYLYLSARGEFVTWKSVILWAISEWYTWAALSPLIFRIAQRFRLERHNWMQNGIVLFAAGVFFCFFQMVLQATLKFAGLAGDLKPRPFSAIFSQLLLTKYHINFLIYAVMIGISHATGFYRRYREREQKLAQLETLLTQSQLNALRMQLHPHFLFNALNSLADLIDRDAQAANRMVARLGDFLRLTLQHQDTQEVTLAQEIDFLTNYLEIEKLRFEDRLSVRMEVAPEARCAKVPHLILQPLVENAVRHGIAQRERDGCIEIHAKREQDILSLQVKDNGPGYAFDKSSVNSNGNGLGLINIRERLKKLYGDRQRFEMSDTTEGGVSVTLTIPFVESEPHTE